LSDLRFENVVLKVSGVLDSLLKERAKLDNDAVGLLKRPVSEGLHILE